MNVSNLPFPFSFVMKYFWLVAIVFTFINALLIKARANRFIENDPSLEDEYNALIRGFVLYTNLPWIVMGIGMIFGKFNSVFDILMGIRSGNPYVLLFYAMLIILWVLLFFWVFFRGGAETLATHPGFWNIPNLSPVKIKTKVVLMLAGGIFGVFMLSTMSW
jgi:hypothetical protein